MNAKENEKIIKQLENGFIIFTGAGVSINPPSSNPIAFMIIDKIFKTILYSSNLNEEVTKEVIVLYEKNKYKMKMESIFEVFLRNGFTQITKLFYVFEKSHPNYDHFAISYLVKLGFCKSIFTLNFDNLHEKSLELLNIDFNSYRNDPDFKKIKSINNKNNIFHLHNGIIKNQTLNYLNTFISNLSSELPENKKNIFIEYLKKYPILCVGYSDDDIDTFKYISKYSKDIFWYSHFKDEILSEKVVSVKNNKTKNFYHLFRKNEKGSLGEYLSNLFFPDSNAEKYYIIFENRINSEELLSSEEKLEYIKNFLTTEISSEVSWKLLLLDLLEIMTNENVLFKILKEIDINQSSNKQEKFNYYRITTHLYKKNDIGIDSYTSAKKQLSYSPLKYKLKSTVIYLNELLNQEKKIFMILPSIILILLLNFIFILFRKKSIVEYVLFLNIKAKIFEEIGLYSKINNQTFVIKKDNILYRFFRLISINNYKKIIKLDNPPRGYLLIALLRLVELYSYNKQFQLVNDLFSKIDDCEEYIEFSLQKYSLGNIYLSKYIYYSLNGDLKRGVKNKQKATDIYNEYNYLKGIKKINIWDKYIYKFP